MKRLATLVLAASFSLGALVTTGQGASATPFSDVPANHWAYQAIQSLAADGLVEGYPDGRFKGDRPLSRYEMAVIVARVVAKLQANGANYASKADLDKLQKLIDALKDELDALGVRVTNLEDALDALDKRTKLAQSLQLHGVLTHRVTARQRVTFPKTIAGSSGIDPFVTPFLTSPDSNSPLEQAGAGNQINVDDKITLSYTINENLTVSFPIHILTYSWGGEFSTSAAYSIYPDIVVNVAKAGAITAGYLRFGQLDNMKSSRVGLAYRAPDAAGQGPGYEFPVQPYQKGIQIGGVLNGLTEFQASFSRLDPTQIYTATNVLTPGGDTNINAYLFTTLRPQAGYVQIGYPQSPAGALQTDTFNAGTGVLSSVYLTRKAVAGTVYISFYNGCTYNSAGVVAGGSLGGGACPAGGVGFRYNDNQNQVIFNTPVPAGAVVGVSYVGLNGVKDSVPEMYEFNARLNQKFKGVPGLEVGLSFNRIFAMDDTICNGTQGTTAAVGTCISAGVGAPNVVVQGNTQVPNYGIGLVSDTVLGLDAQVPLPFVKIGGDKTQVPILYGEAAYSKYSPDYRSTPSVTDSAGVVGVRVKIFQSTASLQYQRVGGNFFSGAPVRYFGNSPQLFSFWHAGWFPGFFGFANNLGINQTFDNYAKTTTAANPALTFIFPVFNPFVATGPQYFSNFAPNTTGFTFNAATPITVGDRKVTGTLLVQNLQELQANGFGPLLYSSIGYPQTGLSAGSGNGTNVKLTYVNIRGGLQFQVPAFGQNLSVNLTGAIDRLSRNDKTAAFGYVPANPGTGSGDPAAAAAAAAAGAGNPGNPGPAFYPNYVNMYHTTGAVAATLPVTRDVTLGGVYNTQRYYGSYGTTLGQNIDDRKDVYTFTATYSIPRTTSAISAAFRNQQYKDNVLPAYNFSQNREDVNFIVRF